MSYEKANDFYLKGLYDVALLEMEELSEVERLESETWILKARILLALLRHKEAIDCLLEALRISPGNIEARTELANAHHGAGNTEAALKIYEDLLPELPLDSASEEEVTLVDLSLCTIVEILEETNSSETALARAEEYRRQFDTRGFVMFNALYERLKAETM